MAASHAPQPLDRISYIVAAFGRQDDKLLETVKTIVSAIAGEVRGSKEDARIIEWRTKV